MKQKIKLFKDRVLNLMFPNNIKCMFCAGELNQKSYNTSCEDCLEILPFIKNPCARCGLPMDEGLTGACLKCKGRNYNFVQARAVFEYTELPMKAVHDVKYNNRKYLIEHMVKYMLEIYATWNVFADIVTSVPMFPTREKERGFNQAKLIAEEFSKLAKLNYVELCAKVEDTVSQTKLNIADRAKNVEDSFAIKCEYKNLIKNKTILIIDDVVTTGATTSELSKVLKKAGAKECYVLSFAHTNLLKETKDN